MLRTTLTSVASERLRLEESGWSQQATAGAALAAGEAELEARVKEIDALKQRVKELNDANEGLLQQRLDVEGKMAAISAHLDHAKEQAAKAKEEKATYSPNVDKLLAMLEGQMQELEGENGERQK